MSRSRSVERVGAASAAPTRLRGKRLAGALVALVVAGALLPPAASAAGSSEHRDLLCGIVRLLDEILRCDAQAARVQPSNEASSPQTAAPSPAQQPRRVRPTPRYVEDLLLVRLNRNVSRQDENDLFARAGVDAVRRIVNLGVTVVHVAPDHRDAALSELRSSRLVAAVERDAVMEGLETTPNDTDWSSQWGLRRANFPTAWDRTRGLKSVLVAVLDTGVNAVLPDLANVAGGFNVASPASAAFDDNGHGTSVAGIIAARANNSSGIAGACWVCSILPIKVLAADGTGDTSLVAAGIVRAADAGARVITMSLGGPADNETLDQAVAYALAKGAILTAAAGNNGTSDPFYPAAIPGVISVAGTDQSDHLYPWSNYGSWVKVAAPGCNPAPSSTGGDVVFCGTSSATPLVAGLVALALSAQPNATSSAIVSSIESTTVSIGDKVAYGRIDAGAALSGAVDAPVSSSLAPSPTGASVSIATLRGRLTPRKPVRVYRRRLSSMVVTATLRFSGGSDLTLSIRDQAGKLLGTTTGRSPVQLTRDLPSGSFAFSVRGRKPSSSFELTLAGKAGG